MLAGQQFAAGPGIATVLPDADFETVSFAGYEWDVSRGKWSSLPGYSDQKRGLGAVGVRVYVEHPTFAPLILGYDLKDGRGRIQWQFGQPFDVLQPLFDHIMRGGLLEAHNMGFEWQCWQYYCVPVLGWPSLIIEQLRCSAAKSAANGLPRALANVGAVLQIEHQKDKEGDRLMKLFSIPRNPSKKDPRFISLPHEEPEEWAAYMRYNDRDLVAESEVSIRSPDLSPFEQRVWFADQHINDRGMQADLVGVEDCIAILEQAYAKYGAEMRALTGGIEATELKQLIGWLSGQGVSMQGMTEADVSGMIARLNGHAQAANGDMYPYAAAYRVLELRQMIGSASVKKLYAIRGSATRAGRLHDLYMYMATHHGRWTGNGPQPQNLYKGEWHTPAEVEQALKVIATRDLATVEACYPDLSALDVLNYVLRSLFIAAPGHTLISSDYSAIEAVVLAVLAGEEWELEVYRTHGMIYEAQISLMTGVPFQEFIDHKKRTGKHHPLRQQGKLAKLSGGYASWIGGWKKFGADKYYANDYELKQAILAFRNTVPMTVELWGGQTRGKFTDACRPELFGLEGAAISAVQNPGTAYRYRMIGFQMLGDALYMQLPSGRLITYHTPRLRPTTRPYGEAWELELSYWGWNTNPDKGPPAWIQMDLYGGVLTQNACGGAARDIMAHGLLNLEAAGYPVVMHTHDEAVGELPIIECIFGDGGKSVAGFERCMNDLPAWAKDWPVVAKGGWMGRRYGKWD